MRFFNLILLCILSVITLQVNFAQDEINSQILNRAKSHIQASAYKEAITVYSFYLRFHPTSVEALSQRAVAHASLGDFDSAFLDIALAFDIAGFSAVDLATVYNNRGQVYFIEGNQERALRDFSRAIDLNPSYADYWFNRAVLYQVTQNWKNALADFEHYLLLNPDTPEIYLNIARIHLILEDIDATIDALDSAIDITPGDPELYIFRGSINLQDKRFTAAAKDYQDWMSLINTSQLEQNLLTDSTTQIVLHMGYGVMHRVPFEAKSGDRLGVVANSTTVDSLVVLLDTDGNPLMADDDSGQGLNSFFVDFTLPESGTYTLLVGHARGGWVGDIELTVQIVPGEGI